MQKKQNLWKHGNRNFVIPEPPADQKGQVGCRLFRTTFDAEIGDEVYVLFMEDPAHCDDYANVSPFNMFAYPGIAETPHGSVAYIVWRIAAGSPSEVLMEQYINPYRTAALLLVSEAANQSNLKLVVIDNQTGRTSAFVDFENVFELDRLANAMHQLVKQKSEGDFESARQYVMNAMTVHDLMGQS